MNPLGDAGAMALVEARLRHGVALHLSDNQITDAGIVALAPKLAELPDLELVFAGSNRFGDAGTLALAAGARRFEGWTGRKLKIRIWGC